MHRKPYTVREWARRGRIRAKKVEYCNKWTIHRDEVERLLAGGMLLPEMEAPTGIVLLPLRGFSEKPKIFDALGSRLASAESSIGTLIPPIFTVFSAMEGFYDRRRKPGRLTRPPFRSCHFIKSEHGCQPIGGLVKFVKIRAGVMLSHTICGVGKVQIHNEVFLLVMFSQGVSASLPECLEAAPVLHFAFLLEPAKGRADCIHFTVFAGFFIDRFVNQRIALLTHQNKFISPAHRWLAL